MQPIRFVAYSDYLCPWCYNASLRLHRLEEEYAGDVCIEWRSYLLRPHAKAQRDLERFRHYTESWLRPGAEPDGADFVPWRGDAGPPTHSIPAHQVAKAAARLGGSEFRRMHDRLLRAYFTESRDVSDADTLRALWEELALPSAAFDAHRDPEILRAILAEHAEAIEMGATGVPALRRADDDVVIVGAHPMELYRRWVEKIRA